MGVKKIFYIGTHEKHFDLEEDKKLFFFVPFDELLRNSDFIIICCSLNSDTKGLFNSSAFDKMKKDAILINTARGAIIDHDALYDALIGGKIAAAGKKDVTNLDRILMQK